MIFSLFRFTIFVYEVDDQLLLMDLLKLFMSFFIDSFSNFWS